MFGVPPLKWSESHGVEGDHQGAGALYFGLPYMLRAKRCVCLGSGAGFVPLQMLGAQRRLVQEDVLSGTDVSLVDANVGIWGLPVYESGAEIDPELRLVKKLTADAVSELSDINYLHVDADHSYDGVLSDLLAYIPKMSGDWAVTVHDTYNPENAHLGIGAWEASVDAANELGLSVMNFKVGCGVALLRRRDG